MTDTLIPPDPSGGYDDPGEPAASRSTLGRLIARTGYVGGVPFLVVVVAILLVTGSAISWVTSPNWGKSNASAPARNVGTVPSGAAAGGGESGTSPGATTLVNLDPNRIQIPAINADAPITTMGETPNRELDIPLNPRIVGWWDGGAHPGATVGTAVLAGHINYAGVTGTLARIGTLNPGDHIYVTGYRNGKVTKLTFDVAAVRTYSKTALPFGEIFNQDVAGRLAVITCGGPFDPSTGNYLDNIVVYAVLAT